MHTKNCCSLLALVREARAREFMWQSCLSPCVKAVHNFIKDSWFRYTHFLHVRLPRQPNLVQWCLVFYGVLTIELHVTPLAPTLFRWLLDLSKVCVPLSLLTPRCRVLLEKLTGLQLVNKFPAFHVTRRFITALKSLRHLSISWASPIQFIYPHPTSWRSILISTHLCLGLPSGLLPSGFPTKTLYTHLSSPIHATCPAHLILLDFITRAILGEEYRSSFYTFVRTALLRTTAAATTTTTLLLILLLLLLQLHYCYYYYYYYYYYITVTTTTTTTTTNTTAYYYCCYYC